MSGSAADDGVDRIYRERVDRFTALRDREVERSNRLGRLRLATFLAAAIPFLWPAPPQGADLGLRFGLAAALGLLFLALVLRHARVNARGHRFEELRRLNQEGRARLRRDWSTLPDRDPPVMYARHPYAQDLDIFGRASIRSLLGPTETATGRSTLADWLGTAADHAEVRERQRAVDELAGLREFRDELTVASRLGSPPGHDALERFLAWAEGSPWLVRRRWLTALAWTLPAILALLLGLHLGGLMTYHAWAAVLLVNLGFTVAVGRSVHGIFDRAFAGERAFQEHERLFELIVETGFEAEPLDRLRSGLRVAGLNAHEQMARLHRIGRHADLRLSMFWLPIQLISLWDIHVLARLESWQRRSGPHVREWLEILGRIEALSALATLRHDHPDWPFPQLLEDGPPRVEASELGHPLLAASTRIANDVQVGPPGTVLFVTGSNMSGKSTLLRAIGTNVVLAQAGGPVCAVQLRLSPVRLYTSMRVHDSLQDGLSHYMAELERLKLVVEAARSVRGRAGQTLLYLLDDVLQGTNTAERRIAARKIVLHLLHEEAIGAVTSHDLALVETPELADAAQPVHFGETIQDTPVGPRIDFDYRLRPGVATSSNALKLLEIMGLDGSDARQRAPDVPDRAGS